MQNLSLSLHSFPDRHVAIGFTLKGQLDSGTVDQLQNCFKEQLSQSKHNWIVDLGGLDYISSAGLGSFLGVLQDLREKGGNLLFVKVPPKIQRIFDVLGFNRIFRVFPDEQKALEFIVGPSPLKSEEALASRGDLA